MSKFELSVNYQKGRSGEINVIAEMTTRGYEIKDYTNDFDTFKHKQLKDMILNIIMQLPRNGIGPI